MEQCCQLWSPHRIQDIHALEDPQRTFTNKTQLLRKSEIPPHLLPTKKKETIHSDLCMEDPGRNSVQRRSGGEHSYKEREVVKGTLGNTQGVKTITHNFTHNGASLFNCMPRRLRDLTRLPVEFFKHKVDKWLSKLPDVPSIVFLLLYCSGDGSGECI